MMKVASSIEKQVKAFCTRIGADRLLVQGAGGNVSWKDGDVLWVKASGTWLAEAESKEIFVPVNLPHLQGAIAKQDFLVKPEVTIKSDLRPSIETLLHALMPQKIVAHLHAVEVLVYLVQMDSEEKIEALVGDALKWAYVEYVKPGAELVRAVTEQLHCKPDVEVVFLANHGVVIGADIIEHLYIIIDTLVTKMKAEEKIFSLQCTSTTTRDDELLELGYVRVIDRVVRQLANDENIIKRLREEWCLYPDHVVFLGAKAAFLEANFSGFDLETVVSDKPPFIFSVEYGAYESVQATPAQKAQLRCYFDVIRRQDKSIKLITLSDSQVDELLDWEAEKYRQHPNASK